MSTNKRGTVIAFTALDGAGKQTQSDILLKKLKERYPERKIFKMSFPNYGSPGASLVESYLRGDFNTMKEYYTERGRTQEFIKKISQFYALDRAAAFLTIDPETNQSFLELYENGAIIICDRYYTCNQLHQSSFLDSPEEIEDYITYIKDFEVNDLGIPSADYVLYLDVSAEISVANIEKRNAQTENVRKDILENLQHLSDVHAIKDIVIKSQHWTVINCHTDNILLPIDAIAAKIEQALPFFSPVTQSTN